MQPLFFLIIDDYYNINRAFSEVRFKQGSASFFCNRMAGEMVGEGVDEEVDEEGEVGEYKFAFVQNYPDILLVLTTSTNGESSN